ncbi:Glycosyltransferase involved in cell wall bisynthesis [Parafrankia irregularis]|uniref:Glycosyltransferase involved in cell wall bisynthesis n=1 Tax=Parafrankia irregularis TaxID=795642 RepID=A0A0S4QGD7_9ACTN|nr:MULTISPECIES: glycosyltransferase [Parafrankia]MBE3199535.1 glycosyltransferase [Parafrankia sp. CH37]CUU53800.1 Glycosyltransferase involved in cell wall bisynthesis [Parafrankia irregularis]
MSVADRASARPRPRTVLHVFGVMDRAGAELRTVDLMRNLDPDRYRFVFVTLTGRPGALAEEIRSLGGSVHPCRLDLGFPVRFLRLLRALRPDVVHSCVATFSGAILLIARAAGVPLRVAHFHSTGDRHGASLRGRVQRAVMRQLIDWFATDLVAVAEATMTSLWRSDWQRERRCRVLYNGLDPAPFERALVTTSPASPASPVVAAAVASTAAAEWRPTIVHVGRPDPVKNRSAAVDVLIALRRRGVPARLRVVGRQDAHESAQLRRRAELGGVADAFDLPGESFDIPGLMAGADLLLLTSRHEGLPTVVLEACAVGTPVLAPDLPGVVEIGRLLDGVTTVPQGCASEAWAEAAAGMLAAPPTSAQRVQALHAFSSSPFVMDQWRRGMTSLWDQ